MTLDIYNFITTADNFTLLKALKVGKIPLSDNEMILIFKQFQKNNNENDYKVVWKDLCQYLPKFNDLFGKERYCSLHHRYNLCGDMEKAIRQSNMQLVEKEFLYFVYEISFQENTQ